MNATIRLLAFLLLASVCLEAQQAIYWKKDYIRDPNGGTVGTAAPNITSSTRIPPGHLVAKAASTSAVDLTWDPPVNTVDHYRVYRRTTGSYSQIGSEVYTASYPDTGLSATTSYVYIVRACYTSGCSSSSDYADSNPDVATTVVFTDDPLTAGSTVIKAVHVTQLRTAVDAVRAAAGASGASWTDSSLSGVVAKADHISELRSNLSSALSTLGVTAPTYTDSTLTAETTVIRKAHIAELRQIVQ